MPAADAASQVRIVLEVLELACVVENILKFGWVMWGQISNFGTGETV